MLAMATPKKRKAGRPPKNAGETLVTLSARVRPTTMDFLRVRAQEAGKPLGDVIDQIAKDMRAQP